MASFRKTVATISVGQVSNYILPLITFPLLVKALDITLYGMWIEAGTIAGLLTTFSAYGLFSALGALVASRQDEADAVYYNGLYIFLIVSGGLTLLMALAAEPFNSLTIRNPTGVPLIAITALTVLTGSLNILGSQVFRLRQRPAAGATFDVLTGLARLLAVLFAMAQRDLLTFALLYVALQGIVTLVQITVAYRGIRFRRPSWPIIRRLLRYGANLAIVSQGEWLVMYGDRLLLSILSTSEAVAIYSAAYRLTVVVTALGGPFLYALLPVLSERWGEGDIAGFQAAIRRSTRLMLVLIVPAVVGLTLTGDALLRVLATEAFAQGSALMGILALGMGLNVVGVNFHYIFQIRGRPEILRQIYVLASIFNIVGNLVAIPLFSYYGAGVMTLLTFLLIIVMLWWRAEMPLKTLFDFPRLARCALASAVMGIWVVAVIEPNPLRLILTVAVGALIYGVSILLLRVIPIPPFIIRTISQQRSRIRVGNRE